jgi:hypothetical protein
MTSLDILTPTRPVSVFGDDQWTRYEATLTFTGRLVGGSPGDPELVEGWLKANLGISDEDQLREWTRRHLAEVTGIDPSTATDEEINQALESHAREKKAQVFKRTPDGHPYVEGRHIKAMLKEATNIAFPQGEFKWGRYQGRTGNTVGGKAPKSYLAERVWVPEQPYVVADDSDGFDLAIGHLKDWRGETRSTIGYYEYCTRPVFSFTLEVLDDCIEHGQWRRIFQTAERNGFGARRSQGAGDFVVTGWEKLD